MTKRKIAGQTEQDVKPDSKDPENRETLHKVWVTPVEKGQSRFFGEQVEDEGGEKAQPDNYHQ